MLALFILCAVIPTSILGWISYEQVTDQLISQSSARLKQESKAQGMVLYDHLLSLKSDLDRLAARLPSDRPLAQDTTLSASGTEDLRFHEVRLLTFDHPDRHHLSDAQVKHLEAGKTLLRIQTTETNSRDIVLLHAVNPDRWEAGLLSALVDHRLLWSTQGKELPADTELTVKQHDQTLFSTLTDPINLPDLERHDPAAPMTESFVWQSDGHAYITGAWTIPLRYIFLADPWIIALTQTKESALAPVDQFRRTFWLVIASTLSVVVMLSLSHIRRSLQPVTLLKEGTTRLATGDFTARVSITSGDEFDDLASSFNEMTGRLSRQFHMLDTLSVIGQAILSSDEPGAMMRLVQARISETIACDAIGMTVMDPDNPTPAMMSVRYLNRGGDLDTAEYAYQVSREDVDALQSHPHHMTASSHSLPGYLTAMAHPALSAFAVFPILVNHRLSGMLVLGYHLGHAPSADDATSARRLADHVAVALTNSRAIESRVRAQMELIGAVDAKRQAEERASVLQTVNQSLETKEERLRRQQSAMLTLVKDRTVFEGSLAETARLVTTTTAQVLTVNRTSVWIFDDITRALYCLDSYDQSTESRPPEPKLAWAHYPTYFESLERAPVIAAADVQHVPHFRELAPTILASKRVVSRLDAPFRIKGRLAGVVMIEQSGFSREWAPDEQQFAQALANFMTLVLEAMRRRESEDALTVAKAAAEKATQAKAEFLANMSHEIRTPMNGVIGMTDILARTSLSETQRHYVDTIRNSGDTLLTLLNDILDFSKIEAGKLEIHNTALDLREVVERTAEQLAERAQHKGLQLSVLYEPAVPTALMGDPIRIRQILTNLLGNAVKFTQRGDVHVTVQTVASGSPGSVDIRLAVTDTGSGISPEGQAKLFQSFSQVDGASTRVHGGTGLGLSICKQLTELMGGTIGVQSVKGQGSTFWIEIPMALQSGQTEPSPTGSMPADLRVCAAVSHPRTRELLTRYLSDWGLVPAIAGTEEEFLSQLRHDLTHDGGRVIALVDETFAGMTDVQLLQTLASDTLPAAARIVRLVSFARRADVENDPLFGRVPFITKPLRYEALRDTVLTLLNEPSLASVQPDMTEGPAQQLSGSVLLGEDNPVNQEIALLMLQSLGCSVTVAQDGREVVERTQKTRYDIVLMDCQMPGMDGLEATRLIRERERETGADDPRQSVPIIALTAHATQQDRERCLEAGMNDYLSKPFTMERLQDMLASWLPSRQPSRGPHKAERGPDRPIHSGSAASVSPAVNRKAWKSITTLQRPGGPDILAKILSLYLADSQQLVDTLHRGVASGNAQLVMEAAHSLKSRSAVLGAVSLSELCRQFEGISRRGPLTDAQDLLGPLDSEFANVCGVFQAELEKRAA